MNLTGIEWVLNPDGTQGCTVNSKTGCKNHTPEGLCLGGLFPCYAFGLANTRLKQGYLANKEVAITGFDIVYIDGNDPKYKDPFYPRFWPERLDKIRAIKKPTGIFLDDMSDWMGDYWPEECTRQELQVMRDCPQHRFYTLTKQPQNLIKWSPFPENCWVGVTATNFEMYGKALFYLNDVKASVKYISFEPLLSSLMHNKELGFYNIECMAVDFRNCIDWLIIGACTGTKREMMNLHWNRQDLTVKPWGAKWTAQPNPEWVREIVEAADKAGIPVFLKNNLLPLLDPEHAQWSFVRLLAGQKLRQELPEAPHG